MHQAVVSLFSIAWLDCLYPSNLIAFFALRSITRKKWHAFLYTVGAYLAYLGVALTVYFGLSDPILRLARQVSGLYARQLRTCRVALGWVCLVLAVASFLFCIRQLVRHGLAFFQRQPRIPTIRPVSLFLLGVTASVTFCYAYYPLYGYIAILKRLGLSGGAVICLLAVFCCFFMLPIFLVLLVSVFLKEESFQVFWDKLHRYLGAICCFCVPVLFSVLAWWGLSGSSRL